MTGAERLRSALAAIRWTAADLARAAFIAAHPLPDRESNTGDGNPHAASTFPAESSAGSFGTPAVSQR